MAPRASSSSSAAAAATSTKPKSFDSDSVAAAPSCVVSVLLSRSTSSSSSSSSSFSSASGTVRVAIAARTNRKRTGHDDPIRYRIEHFAFLDDGRRFTNLDALLTRLAPVCAVYLGCTESAEISSKGDNPSRTQIRRAREVSDLLSKASAAVNTRIDILPSSAVGDDEDNLAASAADNDGGICTVLKSLPKPIHNSAAAAEYVDRTAAMLLGEGTDRHLSYRGDRSLLDDVLLKRAIGLLLRMERTDEEVGAVGATGADDGTEGGEMGTYEILPGTLTSHLVMDRTAAQCVNLLPPARGSGVAAVVVGGTESNNSLYGVLNKCLTRMGSRTLEVWLRQPLVDLTAIVRRQNAVEQLVEGGSARDRLRDEGLGALGGLDLDGLCGRLTAAAAAAVSQSGGGGGGTSRALETLYKIHTLAEIQLPALIDSLVDLVPDGDSDGVDENGGCALRYALDGLKRVHVELSRAARLAEAVLDFDLAPREFLVKATYSEELEELREEMERNEVEVEECHQNMNELWNEASAQGGGGGAQVRLERDVRSGGSSELEWQFRLPRQDDSKILRAQFPDVNIHKLLKNGVYFSTRELRQLAERKGELLADYERAQREVVSNAMSVAVSYVPVLERTSALVAELDVLSSLAYVASYSPHGYCRPEMTDGEEDGMGIELLGARHPCVELQGDIDFIPNDFKLTYGESSFLLVTGPNMGGKSTYIRSLGAIIAMAQIGSFVPCTSARINIVHHILARVGAGDLQDLGISTFMAEMLEASSILRTATKRSLIVIDELGRGTSTFDGYGLASAISEYIVERIGCPTVFATHFHELTALEEKHRSVRNCHVTAKKAEDGTNSLTFLYEVRPGPCLESFGIQVAEMANVPKQVVADAKRKARQLENFDYRRKRRAFEEETCAEDESGDMDFDAEAAAAAMNCLNAFRKMPLMSYVTHEERKAAVMKLIKAHGV